jgi:hypothetical protein
MGVGGDDSSSEDGCSLLTEQEYDVTDCTIRLCNCCLGSTTLHLEAEEAVLIRKTCIDESNKRLPYGELGSVTHNTSCGCCHSFSSNLSYDIESGIVPISPGCGCDAELVQEIVEQLKARMKGRGDTGNIQRAEDALTIMSRLWSETGSTGAKLDAVLAKMGITALDLVAAPPMQELQTPVFQHEEFDMTSCCDAYCCCGKTTLSLDPEEASVMRTTCCSSSSSRRPYGQLGSVQVSSCCGCCHAVSSSAGYLSPACGCEKNKVDEVAEQLKTRMKARGDTGNIQRQEETIRLLNQLMQIVTSQDQKVNTIMGQMQIPVPPPQQSMKA